MQRVVVIAQQNTKTRRAAIKTRPVIIIPYLIDPFANDLKEIRKQIEKRKYLICKNFVLTKN